jgi:hypothetical protein
MQNQAPYRHLMPGRRYQIGEPFPDFDHIERTPGTVLTFRGWSFLPYDDGLSLDFESVDGDPIQIRLQLRPEAQEVVDDNLHVHFLPAT